MAQESVPRHVTTSSHILSSWKRDVGCRCLLGDVALGNAGFGDRCTSLVVVVAWRAWLRRHLVDRAVGWNVFVCRSAVPG